LPKRYIVTGAPGTGKTALLRALQERHWSVAMHESVYRDHGFQLVDIAPGSVAERVAMVEDRLAGEQNGRDKEPTGSSH